MLFFKECKKILRSLSFWIFFVITALMLFSQYFNDGKFRASEYTGGYKIVENHEQIMNEAINTLMGEYTSNNYVCYPYGFYKAVSLKEKKKEKVEIYIQEMMGVDHNGIEDILESHLQAWLNTEHEGIEVYLESTSSDSIMDFFSQCPENRFDDLTVKSDLTYERFTEIMGEIDDILGGGSDFAVDALVFNYSRVDMTDEDSLKQYEAFIKYDRITYALARLFSDYMGIDLAFLPVFVSAVFVAADRRRRMSELVYSRSISSFKLVFTRYAALVVTMFIPIIVFMMIAFIQAKVVYSGEKMSMSAMFTLPTFWLLPNIMVATASGMLLTEVFSAGIAIAFQCVWAFRCLMSGSVALAGDIGKFDLICRHNSTFDRDIFMQCFNDFVFNRIFFMVISLLAVCIAAYVYDLKRGGKFNGFKLFGEGGLLRRKA